MMDITGFCSTPISIYVPGGPLATHGLYLTAFSMRINERCKRFLGSRAIANDDNLSTVDSINFVTNRTILWTSQASKNHTRYGMFIVWVSDGRFLSIDGKMAQITCKMLQLFTKRNWTLFIWSEWHNGKQRRKMFHINTLTSADIELIETIRRSQMFDVPLNRYTSERIQFSAQYLVYFGCSADDIVTFISEYIRKLPNYFS